MEGERREREFKGCLTAKAMGAGDEGKRDYFKVNGNVFKHKRMKYLRSRTMTGWMAGSVLYLCTF